MQTTAQAKSAPEFAITDVYDERRRTFLVQYPVALVVTLGLTGVLAFALVGFLGFRDEFEPALTKTLFHEPWPIFLWLCALIMTLQISIFRHHSLRRQLTATLMVTVISMIIVGITYFYNLQFQAFLQNVLEQLLHQHIILRYIGDNPWTYAIINFGLMAIFWVDTIRRWMRRARGLPPNPKVDIGIFSTGGDDDDMPTLQELISGDLIAGAVLALVLGLIFRAEVVSFFSNLLQVGVSVNTCTVSWPIGSCAAPGGGLLDPPTLSFMDVVQALVYLPLGLLILAISATLSGLGVLGGVDEKLVTTPSEAQASADEGTSTESVSEQVSLTVLNTLRSALNRRVRVAAGNLGVSLRTVAWPALILLGTIAVASVSRNIQQYLHLLSDQRTCTGPSCPDWAYVNGALSSGQQYIAVGLAVLWGAVAVLAIVFSAALLLYSRHVASNTLRFLGLIGFILLLTFWIFSLALSGFNGLLSLTHASGRVPFPQPGVATIVSLACLLIWGVLLLTRRVRSGGSGRTEASAPVGATTAAKK